MELFLNILWVLIALGLLGTWQTQWVHERRAGSRHTVREWTAISVAIVLLFFAVSLSDDLHADLVLVEESAAGRRSLDSSIFTAHHGPSPKTLSRTSYPAITSDRFQGASLQAMQSVEPAADLQASFLQAERPSGRAPPFSCL